MCLSGHLVKVLYKYHPLPAATAPLGRRVRPSWPSGETPSVSGRARAAATPSRTRGCLVRVRDRLRVRLRVRVRVKVRVRVGS